MRDTTIIYRSFYEAIKELPKENQSEVWEAIFEFSLNFNEIELHGISKTIFTLIKPNIEANIKRYKNGTIPKEKRKGSEKEAKLKQKESKSEANKDVDKDKELNEEIENSFEIFRVSYPGTKKGFDVEFENFKTKNKNFKEIVSLLLPALEYQIKIREAKSIKKEFVPDWKHLSTWINQKCWTEEIGVEPEKVWPVYKKGDKIDLENPFGGKLRSEWTQEEQEAYRYRQQEA